MQYNIGLLPFSWHDQKPPWVLLRLPDCYFGGGSLMTTMGMTSEVAKVLVVMAIGAGSMTVSHANDSYFWVVSQFSDLDTATAYKCQTGVTLVQGLVSLAVISILAFFLI